MEDTVYDTDARNDSENESVSDMGNRNEACNTDEQRTSENNNESSEGNMNEACDTNEQIERENEIQIEVEELNLEIPDDPTVGNPRNAGKKAWLSVFGCFLLNVVYSFVSSITINIWPLMKEQNITADNVDDIKDAFDAMNNFGAGIGAVAIIILGYRVTALIGVVMATAGLLLPRVASDDEVELMGFCIAGLAGTGFSFLSLTSVVVPMEYFSTKRFRAIIFTRLGQVLGGLHVIPFVYVIRLPPEWRTILMYTTVLLPLALIGAILITPLNLEIANGSGSFKERILGVVDKKIFNKPLLYVLLLLYFLENYGKPLLIANLPDVISSTNNDPTQIQRAPFDMVAGQAVVLIVLCIKYHCTFKLPNLRKTMFIVCELNGCLAVMTCVVAVFHQFEHIFIAVVINSFSLGMSTVGVDIVLDNIIPDVLGRRNIRIAQGIMGCVAGIGGILVTPSNEGLKSAGFHNDKYYWTVPFYFGAALVLLSAILALVKGLKTPKPSSSGIKDENETETRVSENSESGTNN